MKLIKILTIFNFLGLITVFVACRTGVLNDAKTPKVKSEIKNEKEKEKEKNEIDEAYLEINEFFMSNLTLMDGSKSAMVFEKEDVFDINYLVENIIENNLKLIVKGKTTSKTENEDKKKNREIIPSSKSGKIFSPKKENK